MAVTDCDTIEGMRTKRRPRSGVYRLRNIVTGECYVGSSADLCIREQCHMSCLKNRNHQSARLRKAAREYGRRNFVFEVLEYCPARFLEVREAEWIKKLRPALNGNKNNTRRHIFVTRMNFGLSIAPKMLSRLAQVVHRGSYLRFSRSSMVESAICEFLERRENRRSRTAANVALEKFLAENPEFRQHRDGSIRKVANRT